MVVLLRSFLRRRRPGCKSFPKKKKKKIEVSDISSGVNFAEKKLLQPNFRKFNGSSEWLMGEVETSWVNHWHLLKNK